MAAPGGADAITVTYAAQASLQASPLLPHFISLLSAQLPLRNLHWRPSSSVQTLPASKGGASTAGQAATAPQQPLRTLQEMPVRLVPLQEHNAGNTAAPVLQRTPCVHLFLVGCEDNDLYRTSVRTEIRNWIASLPAHMPPDFSSLQGDPRKLDPEYVIVLVPPMGPTTSANGAAGGAAAAAGAARNPMGRLYRMNKGSVLEKVRADFNSTNREHVVHMSRLPAIGSTPMPADSALWVELLAYMRDSATRSFGLLVELQDRSVVEYDAAGDAGANWTFCEHLELTERLIDTLLSADLLEDCLAIYDGLEALLAQSLSTGAVQFARVGADAPGDDSLLLLGPLRKPYRAQIAAEQISLFDVCCYLFARRAALLGALGHVVQVMQATPAFVANVAQLLRRHAEPPRFFLESWSFSVALDAVEQCQAWMVEQTGADDTDGQDAPLSHAFHASKAELLELALRQLDRVGVLVGHLPDEEPFALALGAQEAHSAEAGDVAHITRKELVEALAKRDVFDSQYRNLLHRAQIVLGLSDQHRRIWRLKYTLGCLEMLRGRFTDAEQLFAELGDSQTWDPLVCQLRARQLACLRDRGAGGSSEAIDTLVAALEALGAVRFLRPLHAHAVLPPALDEQELLKALHRASEAQAADVSLLGHNALKVRVDNQRATRTEDDDGAYMMAYVFSHLRFPLDVDTVSVCVTNYRQDQLWFSSAAQTLQPGRNKLVLYCATPASGFFHIQTTQVRCARVVFEDLVQSAASLSTLADAQQHEYTRARVHIPVDRRTLRVHAVLERHVHLDATRHVELVLESGRNAIRRAEVQLEAEARVFAGAPLSVRLERMPSDAETGALPSADQVLVEGSGAPALGAEAPPGSAAPPLAFTLQDVPPDTHCRVLLPLVSEPRGNTVELGVLVRYFTTQSHADMPRVLTRVLRVDLSPPVGIHVHDHFRLTQLVSQLLLEPSGSRAVRVCAPSIQTPPNASFHAETDAPECRVALTPPHRASFVTRVAPRDALRRRRPGAQPFRLSLAYRAIRDEILGAVFLRLVDALGAAALPASWTPAQQALLNEAITRVVHERSGKMPGALDSAERAAWMRTCHSYGWDAHSDETRAVLEVVSRLAETTVSDAAAEPVEMPQDASLPSEDAYPKHLSVVQRAAWCRAQEHLAWHTLSLPLEIPSVDVVNAVSLRLPEKQEQLTLGRPISVTLEVTSSFLWADEASEAVADEAPPKDGVQPPTVQLQYDILGDYETWLVWGKKKGVLAMNASAPICKQTLTATLIPVQTGRVHLPRVAIMPVGRTATSCETYMTNVVQQVDVLPPLHHETFWVHLPEN